MSSSELQWRLDAEIASLRDKLFNLVAQRNTFSPVSKLPVEILSTIFLMHQQSELTEDDTALNWMRMSHVCRQWRQITINLPQLWSHLNFLYPSWTAEMVKRSKNVGFIISVHPSATLPRWSCDANAGDVLCDIRKFIILNLKRIREININVCATELHFVLKFLLRSFTAEVSKNAPQLQAIRLPELASRQMDPTPLLETAFVHANNIKTLDVTCTNNWDSKLFTNLYHLKVVNPKGFGRPGQVQFLSALERMPQLKTLHLRGEVLPRFRRPSSQLGCRPVSLSELRSLTIEDNASIIPDFMESVKFNTPAVVNIRHNKATTDYGVVVATIANLPSIYSSLASIIRGLRLDLSLNKTSPRLHNIQLEIETWYGVPPSTSLNKGFTINPFVGDPFLTLGLSWSTTIDPSTESQQTRSALSQFCAIFPCQNLHVLSLNSSDIKEELPHIHRHLFRSTLGIQPDLHTVFVSGSILIALMQSLKPELKSAQNSDEDQQLPPQMLLFPKLRHLSISTFDFSEDSTGLFDCLSARMEHGYKLEQLTISNCDEFDRVLMEKLTKVVNILAWDRQPLPHSSSS